MNFVFFSPIAWDNSGGAHRPVQFAQELARRRHGVTYVEIEKSRIRVRTANPRVLNLEELGWNELQLVRAWYGLDYRAPSAAFTRLLDGMPTRGEGNIAVWCAPFRPVLQYLPTLATEGFAIVYDALDDISEMRALGYFCYDDAAEKYLAENSDLIVTLSPRLQRKFGNHPNVKLVRDGVELEPFRAVPAIAVGPERGDITLGFWGTMWDYNLDIPLLQMLTTARPTWQWHFIGAHDLDPARPSLRRALAAPNVHFHAPVTRPQLAQYAASFDVCIVPTPVTAFNLSRDPLKVYEYLACAKPVVTTDLEQLDGMPYVLRSRDAAEFLTNVECAVQLKIDRAALGKYLEQQTWSRRTEELLAAVSTLQVLPHKSSEPPRGAMENVETDLERWQAFARHLERLALDRETHVRQLEAALAASSTLSKIRRALGIR